MTQEHFRINAAIVDKALPYLSDQARIALIVALCELDKWKSA